MKQNYKDFELEDKISTSKWISRLQKKNWRKLQDLLAKEFAYLQSEEPSEIIFTKRISGQCHMQRGSSEWWRDWKINVLFTPGKQQEKNLFPWRE